MDVDVMENQGMSAAPSVSRMQPQKEYRFAVLSGLALALLFGIAQAVGGGTPASLGFLLAIAVAMLLLSNPELALLALTMVFFVDWNASVFTSAIWFTPLVAVAILLHRRDFAWRELSTPLSIPLLSYGLAVIPSLFVALRPVVCFGKLYNMVAFAIAMYAALMAIRSFGAMRRVAFVFLILTAITASDVIVMALASGRREYGFAGVMFVDYAGLSVNVIALMVLFTRRLPRALLAALGLIVGMGLILTQTRNAWIVTGVTLAFAFSYLIRHPHIAGIARKHLIAIAVAGCIVLAGLTVVTIALNPSVGSRATDLAEANTVDTPDALIIRNTLLTRMLIWDTSLNAFIAHPLVGVGVYGFIDASYDYSRLPAILYALYVRNMSPHLTFLEVLAETGLIGMAGFLFLLVSVVRLASRTVREAKELAAQRHAFVAFIVIVYCTISMFFTDAWLWGQGVVLGGLLVGLVLANRRIQEAAATA